MDAIQQALQKSAAARSQRLQALLAAISGEPRFQQLKAELEARIAEETAKLQTALKKDLASADSVRALEGRLPRLVEEAVASLSFHDRVTDIVRDVVASHEKRQPHPTPRELAGLILQTVREVFADVARLSPDEITRLAKAQAESSFAKFVASELWTQEVARIAGAEAERVFSESSKRIQEEVSRVKWVAKPPARAPEPAVDAEGVRKIVSEALAAPEVEERFRGILQAEAVQKQLKESARAAATEALINNPRLASEDVGAAAAKSLEGTLSALRQEIAAAVGREQAAREAAAKEAAERVEEAREVAKRAAEAAARPAGVSAKDAKTIAAAEIKAAFAAVPPAVSEDQIRALAAQVSAKAVETMPKSVDPEEIRRLARAEFEELQKAAPQPVVTGEQIAQALQSETVRPLVQGWIHQAAMEGLRVQLAALLTKVEERVAKAVDWQRLEEMISRRIEEQFSRREVADPRRMVEETARKVVQSEVRPIKEALLEALPAEIQNAVLEISERQFGEWASQFAGSSQLREAVRRAISDEMPRAGATLIHAPDESSEEEPESEFEKGGIREHFLSLREKKRWKRNEPRRK